MSFVTTIDMIMNSNFTMSDIGDVLLPTFGIKDLIGTMVVHFWKNQENEEKLPYFNRLSL